jgi:hypothetical protein
MEIACLKDLGSLPIKADYDPLKNKDTNNRI